MRSEDEINIPKETFEQIKYRFRLSETNFIEFTQKDLDGFRDVNFIDDNGKGKIIPVKRRYDGNIYDVIVPIELIEEVE